MNRSSKLRSESHFKFEPQDPTTVSSVDNVATILLEAVVYLR